VAAALLRRVRRWGVWRCLLFGALAFWTMRLGVLGCLYAFGGGVRRHHIESGMAVLVVVGVGLVALFRRRGEASGRGSVPNAVPAPMLSATTLALVHVGVALLLLAPALHIGLLSDDFVLLRLANRRDFAPWRLGWHARPLPLIVWWALSSLEGDPQVLMHVVNMVLHGINATLVTGLARRLGIPRDTALLSGLLFLVYPAAVESVVWCSGLQDILMTTAALAFAYTWTGGMRAAPKSVAMVAWLVAGLATKETAVIIPLLGLVVAWSPRGPRRREDLILALSTLVLAAVFSAWRLSLPGSGDHLKWPPTLYDLQSMVFRPFGTLAAPWSSALLLARPWLLAVSILFVSALLFFAFLRWSNDAVSGFGLALRLALWIPLAAAPTYGLLYIAPDLQGSRYTYLPAAGGAILLALTLNTVVGSARHSRAVLWVLAAVVLALAAFAQRSHLRAWEDAATLRDGTVAAALRAAGSPHCPTLAFDKLPDVLGGAYVFRNGFDAAIDRVAPDVAARLAPPERAACRFEFDGRGFKKIE
jgi:hypothetical protein